MGQFLCASQLKELEKEATARCLIEDSARIRAITEITGITTPGFRHFPHPFPARMPLEVAKGAVASLTSPRELVIDPMVGSGVVARASLDLGRRISGVDMDPLAVVLTRAFCTNINSSQFDAQTSEVLRKAKAISKGRAALDALASLQDEDQKFIAYWFSKKNALQLIALSLALGDHAGQREWPALAALFSSLIISRGSGASYAMDLSRSRPHREMDKKTAHPFDAWEKQKRLFLNYFGSVPRFGSEPKVLVGDGRRTGLPASCAHAIITSPPYLNAIDYFRTSKFSLIFLGLSLAQVRELRSSAVGTEVGLSQGHLSTKLEGLITKRVADGRRRAIIRRYVFDMLQAMAEARRLLKSTGRALYVVGPSLLSRRDYDAADTFEAIGREAGLKMVSSGRRNLNAANRSLPPPTRGSRAAFFMDRRMTCEFYLLFEKA